MKYFKMIKDITRLKQQNGVAVKHVIIYVYKYAVTLII